MSNTKKAQNTSKELRNLYNICQGLQNSILECQHAIEQSYINASLLQAAIGEIAEKTLEGGREELDAFMQDYVRKMEEEGAALLKKAQDRHQDEE